MSLHPILALDHVIAEYTSTPFSWGRPFRTCRNGSLAREEAAEVARKEGQSCINGNYVRSSPRPLTSHYGVPQPYDSPIRQCYTDTLGPR